jgi:hypothetical protein
LAGVQNTPSLDGHYPACAKGSGVKFLMAENAVDPVIDSLNWRALLNFFLVN